MELAFQVEDPQAPWNAEAFTLAVEDGRLHVRPGGKPELRLGIGALSAALAGFTTFRELGAWEVAEAKPACRGQDPPRRVTWLADHF
ncbi:MAG: Acetyltransferase, gnat family [Acetothermia bacterium 64_32]|nr:MAG: Acetyltransferase, gnat family [Acetothermia bacterium 64_32]HAF70919.1 hypothetical protein [Candidatus Acetothermia bacterium]